MPRAEIATKQAKYTLDTLHAELAGKVQANKEEGERLVEAMKHVEAVLKLLDPDYSLRKISIRRRKPNRFFKRGMVFRAVLDVLREAEKPLSASEIAAKLLAGKTATSDETRDLEGAVRSSLTNHDGRTVESSDGRPTRWSLKPMPAKTV